jgi:uncharacterized protein YebE (UPF0316 family)
MSFYDSPIFSYLVLPVLIVLARICDVTIGTLRIIVLSRGHRYLAPLLGFFEVLVWITVTAKIIQNLHNPICYVAYAGGFALGNLVGIIVEERLAMGMVVIRIISSQDATQLVNMLRDGGYGVTSIPAQGSSGLVQVIFSVIKRSNLDKVVEIVKKFNPKAFYSIEDVRFVAEGVFPESRRFGICYPNVFALPKIFRKGK